MRSVTVCGDRVKVCVDPGVDAGKETEITLNKGEPFIMAE